jgi:hypothetical protein
MYRVLCLFLFYKKRQLLAPTGGKWNFVIKFSWMSQSGSSRPRLEHNSKKDLKEIRRQGAD